MTLESRRRQLRAALARIGPLARAVRRVRRSEKVADLEGQVAMLRDQLAQIESADERPDALLASPGDSKPSGITISVPTSVAPFLTEVPPGHFYSSVPDLDQIFAQADRLFDTRRNLVGVEIRAASQITLFRELAALAREAPLAKDPNSTSRYYSNNANFGVGDAGILLAMLCYLRPRRYLEVGSGFSTALAIDVNERFLEGTLGITAVEPYPDLLKSLLRAEDSIEVLASPVQSVPLDRFASLRPNDILFIDSSHVAKTGSDVNFLLTAVLPTLPAGVYVHFHDMFWPFEYPREWVEMGRAWSECYMLHAFLLFNDAFEIVLWNQWLDKNHRELISEQLPAMVENPGGALWLRRRSESKA